jgi:hypothetical protein
VESRYDGAHHDWFARSFAGGLLHPHYISQVVSISLEFPKINFDYAALAVPLKVLEG